MDDFEGWVEAKNQLSLEYGHVTYHIKGDEGHANKHANVSPLHTPLVPGVGSKGQTLFF